MCARIKNNYSKSEKRENVGPTKKNIVCIKPFRLSCVKEAEQDNKHQDNKQKNQDNKLKTKTIMKKMILTAVAAMTMTLGYAKTERFNQVRNVENYSITFDMRRLAVTLDLDDKQMEAVKVISDNLNDDLTTAATARRFERGMLFHQAIVKDARNMRHVLNDKQYDTYMKLLRATLENKMRR